jgi:putative membrane protein
MEDGDSPADGPSLLGVYLRGACMGAADAVPGVSGGTIALLTGIYQRLIAAITAIGPDRVLAVLAAPLPGRREEAIEAFRELDGFFLAALGAGVLTAVVTFSRVLEAAMHSYPIVTFGGFFGLIAASAWLLRTQMKLDTGTRRLAAVTGLMVAFVLSGRAEGALGHSYVVIFLAGSVAVSAMILPGISGSLILLLLGQYEFMISRLKQFVDGLLALVSGEAGLPPETATIVAFLAGGVFGLFTISHGVKVALSRWRTATMTFLVALVIGALRAPVEQAGRELSAGWTPTAIVAFLLASVVGAVAVLLIERAAGENSLS